jgi:hypothetical protein
MILTILLSSIIILVLILINDLNEMRLWLSIFLDSGINQLFDVIGKTRYYDWWLINMHYQTPLPGEKYRMRDRKTKKIIEKIAPKSD